MENKNPKFQRNIEDFSCENCGEIVKGEGYTNHCPKCLHSKHVDINPGDRDEQCHGVMVPIQISTKRGEYRIQFECEKCSKKIWNKTHKNDNFEIILKIASNRHFDSEN